MGRLAHLTESVSGRRLKERLNFRVTSNILVEFPFTLSTRTLCTKFQRETCEKFAREFSQDDGKVAKDNSFPVILNFC